jgi:hypothetical protein
MKMISFGLASALALLLFTAFGSVGLATRTSVTANVVSMHAVLPDGALMDLRTKVVSAARFDNRSTL